MCICVNVLVLRCVYVEAEWPGGWGAGLGTIRFQVQAPGQEGKKEKATALCPWTKHFTSIVSVHPAVQVGIWITLGKVKAAVQRWQGLRGPELLMPHSLLLMPYS